MDETSRFPEILLTVVRLFLEERDRIQNCTPAAGGFSEARVFRIQADSGVYALRNWPSGAWPLQRVVERHRWLQHLSAGNVRVAVPLGRRGTLRTIVEAGGLEWQLEPWLPGSPSPLPEMTQARWQSMMVSLAQLHHVSAKYIPSPAGAAWFEVREGVSPAVIERRQIIADWTPVRLVQAREALQQAPVEFRHAAVEILGGFFRNVDRVDAELAAFQQRTVPLFPCLRDVWCEHALFDGDQVTGWIDPTAARTDHCSADLSRLLGSLLEENSDEWGAALKMYQSCRKLNDTEVSLIRALHRSSLLLSGMTWIHRWQAGQVQPARLPDILTRMQVIAQRIRHL